MRATLLLCDFAEEINGKLYIMGGGWSRVLKTRPLTLFLAVKLYVPWDQTNRQHTIAARLLLEDGDAFFVDDEHPVETKGQWEVGRPVGTRPGSEIDAAFVMGFQNLDLPDGRYYLVLEIDGNEIDRATFDVTSRKDTR